MSQASAKSKRNTLAGIARGFAHGLGQAVSVTGGSARLAFPNTSRSAAEALQGDWNKLGGDMRRAVAK